ncbi:hypothetical protein BX666DRAFT_1912068 [Dichotomocladium elegans]|nr:hypothetical protein BX666DRAFT_1912068 [Dichotomocladium elegans]
MKFTIFAAAALAVAGFASAATHPAEYCTNLAIATENTSCTAFAESKGLNPAVFAILNHGSNLDDCTVTKGEQYCIAAPRTKAKRCLAEKKKAAAAAAASESEDSVPPTSPTTTENAAPADPTTAPSSNSDAPSPYAIPKSETGGLRLVNKINPNCKWFYTILPTDGGCSDVAAKNNIPETTLYSLNKNLHSMAPNTCDNLDTGKTYCIGL